MKYIYSTIAGLGLLFLTACGSTSTTTTTTKNYDSTGAITSEIVIVEESDVSDFGTLIARGDGKATAMTLSATKFSIGQNGASYLSVSGTSTTAPATEETSAKILEASATVIQATKTEITSDMVSINSGVSSAEEVAEEVLEAEEEADSSSGATFDPDFDNPKADDEEGE